MNNKNEELSKVIDVITSIKTKEEFDGSDDKAAEIQERIMRKLSKRKKTVK